jgi:hypothetical protein
MTCVLYLHIGNIALKGLADDVCCILDGGRLDKVSCSIGDVKGVLDVGSLALVGGVGQSSS